MLVTTMPGRAFRAVSNAPSVELSSACPRTGLPCQGASRACTSVRCQRAKSGVESSFMTPVAPTTKAQASVAAPSRLCRSSHLSRGDRVVRIVPKSSLRVKGP